MLLHLYLLLRGLLLLQRVPLEDQPLLLLIVQLVARVGPKSWLRPTLNVKGMNTTVSLIKSP